MSPEEEIHSQDMGFVCSSFGLVSIIPVLYKGVYIFNCLSRYSAVGWGGWSKLNYNLTIMVKF